MKKLLFIFASLNLLVLSLNAEHKMAAQKLGAKDKQDLIHMFTEFLEGMERSDMPIKEQVESRWWFWESPITRIEKALDQSRDVLNALQNNVYNINTTQEQNIALMVKLLEHMIKYLEKISKQLEQQSQVLGSLDDQSVGEQDFNSVADIDAAQLSLVSWAKTIYREQLKDKFIS